MSEIQKLKADILQSLVGIDQEETASPEDWRETNEGAKFGGGKLVEILSKLQLLCLECQRDTERLDWFQRQHLEELALGIVIDSDHDGYYYVHGDDPKMAYGQTFREAIDNAMMQRRP